MRTQLAVWWPALVTSTLSLLATWIYHQRILSATAGNVSYPIDDAFIHLAIAKTLAFDHTYGVVPGTFTSASSSIAWPPLIALCMHLAGDVAWLPLYLNLAFGALLPFALDRLLRCIVPSMTDTSRLGALLFACFVGPLPTLMTLGMEHTLHALLTVLFLLAWVTQREKTLVFLALLGVAVRYESLFLVALVSAEKAFRRDVRKAALLATFGFAPVVVFGAFLRLHDHPFLPLSVLMKGVHPANLQELAEALTILPLAKLRDNWTSLAVFALGLLTWSVSVVGQSTEGRRVLALMLGAATLQTLFGNLGWFYRYDAYLVFPLAAVSVGILRFANHGARSFQVAMAAALCAALLTLPRGLYAAKNTTMAATNIFEQQVHSAKFLAAHFPSDTVLVNDIGAVAYYRRAPLVDLMGLASKETAEARGFRIDRPLSQDALARFALRSEVAVIYDEWFVGQIPTTWTRVASWTIKNNRVCAFPSVSVYAVRPESVAYVMHAVNAF